jgi:hypothetical protein
MTEQHSSTAAPPPSTFLAELSARRHQCAVEYLATFLTHLDPSVPDQTLADTVEMAEPEDFALAWDRFSRNTSRAHTTDAATRLLAMPVDLLPFGGHGDYWPNLRAAGLMVVQGGEGEPCLSGN